MPQRSAAKLTKTMQISSPFTKKNARASRHRLNSGASKGVTAASSGKSRRKAGLPSGRQARRPEDIDSGEVVISSTTAKYSSAWRKFRGQQNPHSRSGLGDRLNDLFGSIRRRLRLAPGLKPPLFSAGQIKILRPSRCLRDSGTRWLATQT